MAIFVIPASRLARAALLASVALVSGCTIPAHQQVATGEVPLVIGPPVRDNLTPMEGVLACFADHVAATGKPPIVVSVGDVKDYTGKYSINEGNAITQGGALMVYSALGKLSGAVRIAERFDPTVGERELSYIDRRQLGDDQTHDLAGPNGAQQKVPWLPYYGGTIRESDYFIVGGITEVNYDIGSGGFDIGVNQIGAKARTYSEQVAIDLRIVDTRTLEVKKTISLSKQFTGYEVGANIFRFFGSNLFDIDIGARGQEPLQLGIRAAMEEGVVRLVSAVTKVDYTPCNSVQAGGHFANTPAEKLRVVENPSTSFAGQAVSSGTPVNQAASAAAAPSASEIQVSFEFGSAQLMGDSLARIDQIAAAAKSGGVNVLLTSHDTENFDPGQRGALTWQRIAAITSALASRGIAPAAVQLTWQPDASDTSIHRDGPGMQELARLKVGG